MLSLTADRAIILQRKILSEFSKKSMRIRCSFIPIISTLYLPQSRHGEMYKDSDVRVIESKTVGGKIIRKFKDTRADKKYYTVIPSR